MDEAIFSAEQIRAAQIVREWWRPKTDERQAVFEAFCILFFGNSDATVQNRFAEICTCENFRPSFPHDLV